MDYILQSAGHQAVTFAIRSGLTIATSYAVRQVSRFIERLPDEEQSNLQNLKLRLHNNIEIVSPAIDLIHHISARGNTSLGHIVNITKELRRDINDFDSIVEASLAEIDASSTKEQRKAATKRVEEYMLDLLRRIEANIPLINLALTTSGANLQATLPATVSPGRLLQASAHLQEADEVYSTNPTAACPVGPIFVLRQYSIFYRDSRSNALGVKLTWKEELAKCRVQIWRVPHHHHQRKKESGKDDEWSRGQSIPHVYNYQLRIVEDMNDGRYHEELEEQGGGASNPDEFLPGKSREIELRTITRLFFSASTRLLKTDDVKTPVLVLKLNNAFALDGEKSDSEEEKEDQEEDVDVSFASTYTNEETRRIKFVQDIRNIEFMAFELWEDYQDDDEEEEEEEEDDDDNDDEASSASDSPPGSNDHSLERVVNKFNSLTLGKGASEEARGLLKPPRPRRDPITSDRPGLSLLEYLIRLAALQTNDNESVFRIPDERIALYLRDENDANAAASALAAASTQGNGTPFPSDIFDESGDFDEIEEPHQSSLLASSPVIARPNTTTTTATAKSKSSPIIESSRKEERGKSRRRSARLQNQQQQQMSTPLPRGQQSVRRPGTKDSDQDATVMTPWELDRLSQRTPMRSTPKTTPVHIPTSSKRTNKGFQNRTTAATGSKLRVSTIAAQEQGGDESPLREKLLRNQKHMKQ